MRTHRWGDRVAKAKADQATAIAAAVEALAQLSNREARAQLRKFDDEQSVFHLSFLFLKRQNCSASFTRRTGRQVSSICSFVVTALNVIGVVQCMVYIQVLGIKSGLSVLFSGQTSVVGK